MAWKPKTVAGKILKGLTIGVGVAAGAALVVGTAGAAVPAIGTAVTAVGGVVGKVLNTSVKTVDAVATKAADLVSGVTKDQRKLISEQKDEAKVAEQKLTTVEKLVKAGATVDEAANKAGVSLSSLAGLFGVPSTETTTEIGQEATLASGTVPITNNKMLMYGGIALAALFVLPKLLGGRRRG